MSCICICIGVLFNMKILMLSVLIYIPSNKFLVHLDSYIPTFLPLYREEYIYTLIATTPHHAALI